MNSKVPYTLLFIMMLLFNVLYFIIYWLHLWNVMCSKSDGFGQLRYYMCNYIIKEEKSTPLADLVPCPETSPRLMGQIAVKFDWTLTLDSVRMLNPVLRDGGRSKPTNCTSLQKVAVIVPFRNRDHHLKYLLHYLHPLLERQQLDYGVYIINQLGETRFNRAKLLNVGYAEALKEYDFDCFVFSDVDLVPMDDRNTYRCFSQPRHLSVAIDKFGFRLPYKTIFGGVCSLSKEQYLKINGFPNRYWGWGGEDDDVSKRITLRGLSISRPDMQFGRYRMIRHKTDPHNEPNPQRFTLVNNAEFNITKDGYNSLHYTVVKIEKEKLFTMITVDVGTPP